MIYSISGYPDVQENCAKKVVFKNLKSVALKSTLKEVTIAQQIVRFKKGFHNYLLGYILYTDLCRWHLWLYAPTNVSLIYIYWVPK